MALAGAITALQLLAKKGARLKVLIVSDSQYLVRGMREWVSGWVRARLEAEGGADREPRSSGRRWSRARGCTTCSGSGCAGTRVIAKNEYANDLAVKAAREQATSDGMVPSGFEEWLSAKRAKGAYLAYDPDEAFSVLERRLAGGELMPISEEG